MPLTPPLATLLTGLTPHQHGVYQRPEAMLPDSFQNLPTVPGLLREAGYRTLMIGKWHLEADPWRSGFSDVRTWLPSGIAEYRNPLLAHGNSREMVETKGFTQQIFADEAIRFVRSPAAKEGLAGSSDLPASSLDVPVTLVTLAGIHPPATWAGRDLLAALRRDPKNGLEDACTEWADDGERWGAEDQRPARSPGRCGSNASSVVT